ncbi:MAG: hypothetical protein U0325_33565 [Polyangiales bacterium]
MKLWRALGLWVLVTTSCATAQREALHLPPPNAPLELRVAAYRAGSATIRASLWRSWRVQVGDEPADRELRAARPLLENSPEASQILHERDQQSAIGWGLLGGGTALTLGGVALLPLSISDGSRDRVSPLVPALVSASGLVMLMVSVFINGAAEPRVTYAVESYNRWLWDALALPRALRTPHPAPPAPGLAPWAAPP